MTTRPALAARLARAGLAALMVTALVRCSGDPIAPTDETRSELDLNIIKLPASAPPFYNTSVSFFAKVGQDGAGFIYFQDPSGGQGEKFAELKIPGSALLARPDGTPFGPGDSVLIEMRVTDQSQLLVELQPSGISFRSTSPAELKLSYGETGGDLNHDGEVDARDSEIEQKLAIWRQAKPGDPFVKIGTIKLEESSEVEAKLSSFSRYAIAY